MRIGFTRVAEFVVCVAEYSCRYAPRGVILRCTVSLPEGTHCARGIIRAEAGVAFAEQDIHIVGKACERHVGVFRYGVGAVQEGFYPDDLVIGFQYVGFHADERLVESERLFYLPAPYQVRGIQVHHVVIVRILGDERQYEGVDGEVVAPVELQVGGDVFEDSFLPLQRHAVVFENQFQRGEVVPRVVGFTVEIGQRREGFHVPRIEPHGLRIVGQRQRVLAHRAVYVAEDTVIAVVVGIVAGQLFRLLHGLVIEP